VGAWRLVQQTELWANGARTFPRGEQVHGLIVYSAGGWMSAQLGRAKPRASIDQTSLDFALEDTLAYHGRFSVDEQSQQVTHHLLDCSYLAWRGTDLVRSVSIPAEGSLQLTAVRPGGGAQRVLLWRRPTEEPETMTANELVGAWALEEYTQTGVDGVVTHPMGVEPYGLLQYGADGWMSVIISRRDRDAQPALDSDAGAYHQFVSYYGRWSADIDAGIVTHHTVFATYAPMHAADLKRTLAFLAPDVITLSAYNAGGAPITLRWRRQTGG
jgi:hypothetical protein